MSSLFHKSLCNRTRLILVHVSCRELTICGTIWVASIAGERHVLAVWLFGWKSTTMKVPEFVEIPPPKTNMTMENPLFEDVLMYFLSNIGIFQFHVSFQECIRYHKLPRSEMDDLVKRPHTIVTDCLSATVDRSSVPRNFHL